MTLPANKADVCVIKEVCGVVEGGDTRREGLLAGPTEIDTTWKHHSPVIIVEPFFTND